MMGNAESGCKTPSKEKETTSSSNSHTGLSSLHRNLFVPSRIVRTEIPLPWMPEGTVAFTLDNGQSRQERKASVHRPPLLIVPLSMSHGLSVLAANVPLLFLFPVFTPDECAKLIHLTETECSYGAALVNVGGGRQQLMSDVRNNSRAIVDDAIVGGLFFERVRPFLPQQWTDGRRGGSTCQLAGLNERLRFLKYTPGQRFAPHYDGTFQRAHAKAGFDAPELSFVTVQLYLNSGEEDGGDFAGGSTAFIDPRAGWTNDEPSEEHLVHCVPRVGRVLVFQHAILHQGSKVRQGTKYCLRTDAMYQPPTSSGGAAADQLQPEEPQQQEFPMEEAIDLPQA